MYTFIGHAFQIKGGRTENEPKSSECVRIAIWDKHNRERKPAHTSSCQPPRCGLLFAGLLARADRARCRHAMRVEVNVNYTVRTSVTSYFISAVIYRRKRIISNNCPWINYYEKTDLISFTSVNLWRFYGKRRRGADITRASLNTPQQQAFCCAYCRRGELSNGCIPRFQHNINFNYKL